MNKRDRMHEQIRQHGESLRAIFGLMDADPVALAKSIHRYEVKAHRLAEDYCNGTVDSDEYDIESTKILKALNMKTGFKSKGIPVFLNGDPRGYALKIDDAYVREHQLQIHRDWGGYGILAPEFDGR